MSTGPIASFATAILLLAGTAAHAGQPGFGPWASGEQAEVRLIAGGIGDDGRLSGGIEIMLEPGWWTYWRSPGAAGVPPVIDFAGSENLGTVAVAFPLPERHDGGYGATNIYPGGVILPFTAEIPDPSAPVELKLSLDLGVCQEICIPDRVEASIDVPAGLDARIAAATLAGARARVPGAPLPGVLAVESARRTGGDDQHPVFDIVVTAPVDAEMFVEGPADWYAGVPERLSGVTPPTYRVTIDRVGATSPIAGGALRVTLAADGKAIEQVVGID
jgi:DsbC/DsbD-like thiol-disulfide interchange protein